MRVVPWPAVLVAAVAAACSPSSDSSGGQIGTAPDGGVTDGGSTGGQDGGTVGSDAGGSTGGAQDAGSGGGGGGGSGGGGSGGGGGGGSGGGGGGDQGGGSGSGGTTACSTVDVSPGNPDFTMDLSSPNWTCSFGRPDDLDGTIPLARASGQFNEFDYDWLFVRSSDGQVLGEQKFDEVRATILTQPQGFALFGTQPGTQAGTWILSATNVSHEGSIASEQSFTSNVVPSVTQDPAGGIVIITIAGRSVGSGAWEVDYQRLDRSGAPETGRVRVSSGTSAQQVVTPVAGVTLSSHTLVLYRWDGTCQAVWLDRQGNAMTPPFAAPNCQVTQFYPLLDGGLAVEVPNGPFAPLLAYEIRDGQTQWEALPEFLANKSVAGFFLLPGGRGYALRGTDADRSLHTFDPAGNACASVTRPELDTGLPSIGRDGTLVVQDFAGGHCKFAWWAQLWH
jgi:hypothetical protein